MRDITAAARAALSAEQVVRTAAVELDWPDGVVRLNGSPAPLIIDGQEYLGVGGLGGISKVQESSELRAYSLTLKLAGIPRDAVAAALTQAYQGRSAKVWEVLLHPKSWQVIDAPILSFRGRMDQMNATLGTTATVTVVLKNRLADWERPRLRRFTDDDQKRQHPADRGFEFLTATVEKEITWPAASFWDRK